MNKTELEIQRRLRVSVGPSTLSVFNATMTLPLFASDKHCSVIEGLVMYLQSGTPPRRSSLLH